MDSNILLSYGAVLKKIPKGDTIFFEGENAKFYFQVHEGAVKMISYGEDGRIFIQKIFKSGESFGEPPLFINKRYPASAIACKDTIIYTLRKESLLQICRDFPQVMMSFMETLSRRLYFKSENQKIIVQIKPEERILKFLSRYKTNNSHINDKVVIPFTRQEIADMLGLRVETVIRTIKKMQEKNMIQIKYRKIIY